MKVIKYKKINEVEIKKIEELADYSIGELVKFLEPYRDLIIPITNKNINKFKYYIPYIRSNWHSDNTYESGWRLLTRIYEPNFGAYSIAKFIENKIFAPNDFKKNMKITISAPEPIEEEYLSFAKYKNEIGIRVSLLPVDCNMVEKDIAFISHVNVFKQKD